MADAAGLAIGIAALFHACIDGFKIIFAAQDFAKDFEVLNASFQQQRLRFSLWGEAVGLFSDDSSPRPYLKALDDERIRPTILQSLSSVQYLLKRFKVFESRYGLRNDATLSLVNISISSAVENRFTTYTRRNQKQKGLKEVTRWAIFDAEKLQETVERLRELIDGLESISNQLKELQSSLAHGGMRTQISLSTEPNRTTGRTLLSIAQLSMTSGVSRQIQALDLQQSLETFVTARSSLSLPSEDFALALEDTASPLIDRPYPALLERPFTSYLERPSARRSVDTYTSTTDISGVSDLEGPVNVSLQGSQQQSFKAETTQSPWTADLIPSVPRDFAELYPCTSTIYMKHDDTTVDGNMDLQVYTASPGDQRVEINYMILFHLRLHDLRSREFFLRRYCRESGREVCNTFFKKPYRKRVKFLKTSSTKSSSVLEKENTGGLRSRASSSRSSRSSWFKRRGSQSSHASQTSAAESDYWDEPETDAHVIAVEATSTRTIKLDFSNYAHLSLRRRGRHNRKRYTFEHWGEDYSWQRRVSSRKEVKDMSSYAEHALWRLYKEGAKEPMARIVPKGMQTNGAWVPQCEMRILDDNIITSDTDISDVVLATGVVALVDNAIRSTARLEQISSRIDTAEKW